MVTHHKKIFASIDICAEQLHLDPKRINLLGFSQGASLSIYSSLSNPNKYNSVIALSGFFPVEEHRESFDTKSFKNLDVFIGHGKLDPVVPLNLGRDTRRGLEDIGVKVSYNEYQSQHTISNDCLSDVLSWLKKKN